MDYHNKYIKYKQKYLKLKNQQGGKIPFVELDNETKDYFPFTNDNFNYYNDDYSLIFNSEGKKYYLLDDKFTLKPIQFAENLIDKINEFNNLKNTKNIINNNNIYKLADEQIDLFYYKIPFHLCLLSKYKILDNLYQKHINKQIDTQKIIYLNYDKNLYKLDKDSNKVFLKNNAHKVFKKYFNFFKKTDNISDITYNYNILLKYSYCNKFLELLQLIYNIQSKIVTIDFDIITSEKSIDFQNIKIFNKFDGIYTLEDFIIINIINFFIPTESILKNKFDKIYNLFFKIDLEFNISNTTILNNNIIPKQTDIDISDTTILNNNTRQEYKNIIPDQTDINISDATILNNDAIELKDYNNAIETYINISDTTLLFKYINDNRLKDIELIKTDIRNKISKIDSDLKSLKEHLEDDIKDIKQLLLFNLYVDNEIIQTPQFSYIFYATFIYYRIKKPLISSSNLYPINENNFICSLINIKNEELKKLINDENKSSNNIPMFKSDYIKHPIDNNSSIKFERYNYTSCVENVILEFIKILFWDNYKQQFKINLPEEIVINTEPLISLNDILNDINQNLIKQPDQTNIKSLYNSQVYHKKIHNLFSGHNNIEYLNLRDKYQINSTKHNFYEMLRIILNFKNKDKLNEYLNNINKYNQKITKITEPDKVHEKDSKENYSESFGQSLYQIDIYIEDNKLYNINILSYHSFLEIFDNTDIFKLIEYDYLNLLLNNSDIISNYNFEKCEEYILNYEKLLTTYKEDYKKYINIEYLAQFIIIKYPILIKIINNKIKIIMSIFLKNHKIIDYIDYIHDNDIQKILDNLLLLLKEEKVEDEKYKEILKNIISISLKYEKKINIDIDINHDFFVDIVLDLLMSKSGSVPPCPYCKIIDYLNEKHPTYIRELLDKIDKNNKNYTYLAICFLRKHPESIEIIDKDHIDYKEIVINSINIDINKYENKIVDYLFEKYGSDYIFKLLNIIDNLQYSENGYYEKYNIYNYLLICMLRKSPKFIEKIHINKITLKIILSSIKINDEINCKSEIVEYLVKNHYNYIIELLKKESDDDNYNDLVICIRSLRPDLRNSIK